ncbi:TlpA disulfide reductase family protein [Pedobacter sp. Du54]|uniref:TlpA family protein disulfide reductase n=1 Tax=Pedobacter anseongensis TaxID=3133439 RepID=UPI0030B15C31
MIKVISKIGLLVLFITNSIVNAQMPTATTGLNIGDEAPDFLFKNVKNLPSQQQSISDFKGKLLILDFWNTGCGSCLGSMPKMDSLQRAFKNEIQIILISEQESMAKVEAFLKNFKNDEIKAAIANLPMICGDSRWGEFFKHRSVPHHVWIADGKVVAITNGYNTNQKNIADHLKGKSVQMQLKDDFLIDKFPDLILKTSKFKPAFSSAFYPYVANIKKDLFLIDSANGVFSRRIAARTLSQMAELFYFPSPIYGVAVPRFLGYNLSPLNNNRIIYEGKVMNKLLSPRDKYVFDQWNRNNMFIYEITLPLSAMPMVPDIAKRDVSNYSLMKYNISIAEQEIETDCYVVKFNDISRLKTKHAEGSNEVELASDTILKVINLPFENIYWNLGQLLENRKAFQIEKMTMNDVKGTFHLPSDTVNLTGLPSLPLVFDTERILGNFDLEIRGNMRSYKELKQLLASKGIDLSIKKRKIKYLVFKDLTE